MIIVYHNNEKASMPSAQLLVQKGFDNIYMLSCGIEEFLKVFPEECEGEGAAKYREIKQKTVEQPKKQSKYRKPVQMDDTASIVSGVSKISFKK